MKSWNFSTITIQHMFHAFPITLDTLWKQRVLGPQTLGKLCIFIFLLQVTLFHNLESSKKPYYNEFWGINTCIFYYKLLNSIFFNGTATYIDGIDILQKNQPFLRWSQAAMVARGPEKRVARGHESIIHSVYCATHFTPASQIWCVLLVHLHWPRKDLDHGVDPTLSHYVASLV